jgi:EAL domain-containing protein (putative c-di-GMP-specific phosphodiesterase class I)
MTVERPPRRRFVPAGQIRSSAGRRVAGGRAVVTLGRFSTGGEGATAARIRQVLDAGGPSMVFQPQLSLTGLQVKGYEALARFPGADPAPGPWFALARQVGLAAELEAQALVNAFAAAARRPTGSLVAVNLSPAVLCHPAVLAALPDDLTGFEIELTEHAAGVEADLLRDRLRPLRDRGAQLAIDDVGTAYSGLRRVVELTPDTLKLDRQLVTGVSRNGAKAALIRAVVDFAGHVRAAVCAEGVEDLADLARLGDLGVGYAQGWAVGAALPGFGPARDEALAAGGAWLDRTLNGRLGQSSSTQDQLERRMRAAESGAESMEELVCQLAGCADPAELQGCAGQIAAVLGCDRCDLSWSGAETAADAALDRAGRLQLPVTDRGRTLAQLTCVMADGRPWSGRQIRTARLVASVIASVAGRVQPPRLASDAG